MSASPRVVTTSVKPVQLSLDDVQQLWVLISGDEQATLEADDLHLAGPEELSRIDPGAVQTIRMTRRSPFFRIDIGDYGLWLYAEAGDPSATELLRKARAIVIRRRRWYWPLTTYWLYGVIGLVWIGITMGVGLVIPDGSAQDSFFAVMLALLLGIGLLFLALVERRGACIVLAEDKRKLGKS